MMMIHICVCSLQTHCSRYVHGHMRQHGTETGHSMVLSFADISAWCYECDAYVHHAVSFTSKYLLSAGLQGCSSVAICT